MESFLQVVFDFGNGGKPVKHLFNKFYLLKTLRQIRMALRHLIKGDHTVKNITKPISFKAAINNKDGKVTATTEKFVLDLTEWGINYQSKKIFAELKDKFIHDEMEYLSYWKLSKLNQKISM